MAERWNKDGIYFCGICTWRNPECGHTPDERERYFVVDLDNRMRRRNRPQSIWPAVFLFVGLMVFGYNIGAFR